MAQRHFRPLGLLAGAISLVTTVILMAVLAATGTLSGYADGSAFDSMLDDPTPSIPAAIVFAGLATALVSSILYMALSGVATVIAAGDAMGDPSTVGRRLVGRVVPLLVLSAVITVFVLVGLVLLIVPGIIAYLLWVMAAPVSVMERRNLWPALRRSRELSHGYRWRMFGILLLLGLITGGIDLLLTGFVTVALTGYGDTIGSLSATAAFVIVQFVGVAIAAVTGSWSAAVVAILYIDLRVRKENLGDILRAHAAAQTTARPAGS